VTPNVGTTSWAYSHRGHAATGCLGGEREVYAPKADRQRVRVLGTKGGQCLPGADMTDHGPPSPCPAAFR
jgi:hypothetical protein